jgi:cytidylate kinase
MKKQEIISIHGKPGSGKTKTSKYLLELLASKNFSYISTGSIAKEIAISHGFSEENFDKFPQYAREKQIPYDKLIDDKLVEISTTGTRLIVDSRLGYFFLKRSFKVLLDTPVELAAERIFSDLKRKGNAKSIEEVISNLSEREKSDRLKYLEMYKTDYTDLKNFDFITDTKYSAQDVANLVFVQFRQWLID